ncbi:efflux RND transporter periplasmic adaptor subunit [Sphingomonas sp.]|uniref:efflux RND transporter periplasmic adaptor subunit n=1 Tax=Sphingomonas sp. TaxID=28214 RepID=UPI002FCC1685
MNVETADWEGHSIDAMMVDEEGIAMRRRRIIIAAVAAAALAVLVALALLLTGGDEAATPKAGAAPHVTVIVPGRQQVARVISATGSLAARREMPVGVAGEGGMVARVLVDAGDWVGAGQTLAVIERSVQAEESRQLAASIDVARADAALAQQELERAQALVSRGFVSKADVDRRTAARDAANARVRVAQAQLGQSRARIGRLDIRAPASGLVLERKLEAGQVVGPGSGALFRIAQNGQMELRARLSQEDLARVTIGTPAIVTPVGSTETFAGPVWQVAPAIDPQTRQGDARIALPYAKALRPGGFASVEMRVGMVTAPLLPESAVQSDDRGNYVYVVDGANKVARRGVTVGDVSDAGVAITQGLQGNERIVLSAGPFLNPGDSVQPVRARTAR